MLSSRIIVNDASRTTITASTDDLRTLKAEADRRGTSLAAVLREAVSEKAHELRTSRRPRLGVARSVDGRRAADVASEPVAREPR
jgi:hypothetical protein